MKDETKKIALSVSETARILGISRPTVYQLLRRSDFPAFRIGSRWLVSRSGLEAWVKAQSEK